MSEPSFPRVGEQVVSAMAEDGKTVRVLLPLFYGKNCLNCHGAPKGEPDVTGDPVRRGAGRGPGRSARSFRCRDVGGIPTRWVSTLRYDRVVPRSVTLMIDIRARVLVGSRRARDRLAPVCNLPGIACWNPGSSRSAGWGRRTGLRNSVLMEKPECFWLWPRFLLSMTKNSSVLPRFALEEAGYKVTEAANGRQGSELYRQRPADLVITDIVMPELNGLDMLIELTREFLHARVIAISGVGGGKECLGCCETPRGTADLPWKPFSMEHLLVLCGSNWIISKTPTKPAGFVLASLRDSPMCGEEYNSPRRGRARLRRDAL